MAFLDVCSEIIYCKRYGVWRDIPAVDLKSRKLLDEEGVEKKRDAAGS